MNNRSSEFTSVGTNPYLCDIAGILGLQLLDVRTKLPLATCIPWNAASYTFTNLHFTSDSKKSATWISLEAEEARGKWAFVICVVNVVR